MVLSFWIPFYLYPFYDKFYILKGSAGTGKTTVITHFLNNPKFNSYKIAFSATTNKAVSVLKQMSPFKEDNSKYSFLTIHKLLNIRRKINKFTLETVGDISWAELEKPLDLTG